MSASFLFAQAFQQARNAELNQYLIPDITAIVSGYNALGVPNVEEDFSRWEGVLLNVEELQRRPDKLLSHKIIPWLTVMQTTLVERQWMTALPTVVHLCPSQMEEDLFNQLRKMVLAWEHTRPVNHPITSYSTIEGLMLFMDQLQEMDATGTISIQADVMATYLEQWRKQLHDSLVEAGLKMGTY
jgi:hypothetical protein